MHAKIVAIERPGSERFALQVGFELSLVGLDPLPVGVAPLEPRIHVGGKQKLAGLGVRGQHLPGLEPALGLYLFRLIVVDADLGGQGNVAVAGDDVARRPQAVAVHDAGGVPAVGKHDARRSVPGLHMHAVVFVEGLEIRVHAVDVLPGRGNEQPHGAKNVHAALDQRLEHVVQAAGVGISRHHQRANVVHVFDQRRVELVAARLSPVAVALDGIDFAVVGEKPERLRQPPFRPGVGGKALMKNAQ